MKSLNNFFIFILFLVPVMSFSMDISEEIELGEGLEFSGNDNNTVIERLRVNDNDELESITEPIGPGVFETFIEENCLKFPDCRPKLIHLIEGVIRKGYVLSLQDRNCLNKLIYSKYSLFNEVISNCFDGYEKKFSKEGSIRYLRLAIKNIISWFMKNDFDPNLKDFCEYDSIKILKLLKEKISVYFNNICQEIRVLENNIKIYEKSFQKKGCEFSFSCGKRETFKFLDNKYINRIINSGSDIFILTPAEKGLFDKNPARICEFCVNCMDRFNPENEPFLFRFLYFFTANKKIGVSRNFFKFLDNTEFCKSYKLYFDLCSKIGERNRLHRFNLYIDRQIERLSAYKQKMLLQADMYKDKKNCKFSNVSIFAN